MPTAKLNTSHHVMPRLSCLFAITLALVTGCGGSSGGTVTDDGDDFSEVGVLPDTVDSITSDLDAGNSDTDDSGVSDSDSGNSDTDNSDPGSVDPGNLDPGSSGTGSSDTGSSDTGVSDTGDADTSDPESVDLATGDGARLSIMAVGDSITHGVLLPQASASWRLPFTQQLDASGCLYEMTGSQITNALHSAFESPHESYSSQQANHFITGFTNYAGTNDGIFTSMATFSPDVVLLHIGTNDAIQAQDNQETLAEIDQIVTTVLDAGGDVIVANLIPSFTSDFLVGVDDRISELGDLVDAYVAQLGNSRVNLVDVRSGFTEDLMFDDGVHPNDEGSAFIASRFFSVFNANGYCIQR